MKKDKYNLICIKMFTGDGEYTSTISFNQYLRGYVEEKWSGERRYNKKDTIFGYWHTKTIVIEPIYKWKSVTEFVFPNSLEEAIEIDKEYYKK